jgi:hypothetical protein
MAKRLVGATRAPPRAPAERLDCDVEGSARLPEREAPIAPLAPEEISRASGAGSSSQKGSSSPRGAHNISGSVAACLLADESHYLEFGERRGQRAGVKAQRPG